MLITAHDMLLGYIKLSNQHQTLLLIVVYNFYNISRWATKLSNSEETAFKNRLAFNISAKSYGKA